MNKIKLVFIVVCLSLALCSTSFAWIMRDENGNKYKTDDSGSYSLGKRYDQPEQEQQQSHKTTVAVMQLKGDPGNITTALMSKLSRAGYVVIDREHLKDLFQEAKLSLMGLTEYSEIAKLKSVDYLVYGDVSWDYDKYDSHIFHVVSAYMVDVNTGETTVIYDSVRWE